jgi:hypothetical protein
LGTDLCFQAPVVLPQERGLKSYAYVDNSPQNPNNPNDPPKAIRFEEPLCELFITQPLAIKTTAAISLLSSIHSNKSGEKKYTEHTE